MLHVYGVAINTFWEAAIAEGVTLGFSREAVLELTRRTSELTDDLTTHAAETYVREISRLRALPEQEARDLLELLLRGEVDAEALATHHAAPGLDSAETLVVVVGRIARTDLSESDALETAATAITGALSTGHASPPWSRSAPVSSSPSRPPRAAPRSPPPRRGPRHPARPRHRALLRPLRPALRPRPRLGGLRPRRLAVSRASLAQAVVFLAELPWPRTSCSGRGARRGFWSRLDRAGQPGLESCPRGCFWLGGAVWALLERPLTGSTWLHFEGTFEGTPSTVPRPVLMSEGYQNRLSIIAL
jgi:hypothetical protein